MFQDLLIMMGRLVNATATVPDNRMKVTYDNVMPVDL